MNRLPHDTSRGAFVTMRRTRETPAARKGPNHRGPSGGPTRHASPFVPSRPRRFATHRYTSAAGHRSGQAVSQPSARQRQPSRRHASAMARAPR